jgi:uncharacterized membrane protein YvbJ
MKCPKCQTVNNDAAKFCLECGQKLEVKCPQCGHSAPPSAKFCDECGYDFTKTSSITPQPIETPSRSAITDHERKNVTIMFEGDHGQGLREDFTGSGEV